MKKKFVLPVAGLVIIILGIIFVFMRRVENHGSIRTTGIVEGIEANVSSTVQGRIVRLFCREGDSVKEGVTLVELESNELKASVDQALASIEKAKSDIGVSVSAIAASKANVKSTESDIESAKADIERARAQMNEAGREFDRSKKLFEQRIIPRSSLDTAMTNYDTAVANYNSGTARLTALTSKKDAAIAQLHASESQLTSYRSAVKQSEANLAYAQAKLAETIIKSPLTGTVVFQAFEQGETVNPGTTILTLMDLDRLYVRADIEETTVGSIRINQQAIVRAGGDTKRLFKGKVSEIGAYAEFATQKDVARGRQDIKTFRVKIALENTGGFLKPGMTVEVEVPKG
jgi:multidrug resistance efflux pump